MGSIWVQFHYHDQLVSIWVVLAELWLGVQCGKEA